MPKRAMASLALLLAILLVPGVLSHVPLGGGENHSLANATLIPDVGKSYTVFSDLHEVGEGRYYKFVAEEGERILIILQVSLEAGQDGLEPGLALMGPSLTTNASLPPSIEVPPGAGILEVDGVLPQKIYYEGFSPAVFFRVATLDINAPSNGTYYFVVYSMESEGNFNFAVGYREEFTLGEWLSVPIDQIDIYQWEGQPLYLIVLPMVIVIAAGLTLSLLCLKRAGARVSPFLLTSLLAGLFFLGSSAMTLYQLFYCIYQTGPVPEALITVIFAAIPLILAILTLRLSFGSQRGVTRRHRVFVALMGVIALFFWAGFYVGPALALISAVLPPWKKDRNRDAAAGN